jgi:hypothetical protein
MPAASGLPRKPDTTVKRPANDSKRSTPVGTDRALSMPTSQGSSLDLTFWDLWFAIVAARDCNRDLLELARRLTADRSSIYDSRDSVERKQSHLLDLDRRLTSAGLTIDRVIAAAGDLARTERRRAEKFVLKDALRERDWSAAMHDTPRKRHHQSALRGSWPGFPISPEPFAAEIWSQFKTTGFYSERASFGVSRKLDRFLERADRLLKKKQFAEAQALLRAWITVIIELIAMADDSFGCIGDSFGVGFETYLNIPLAETGIEESVFFADLLDFLIWEDHGFTWKRTDGYFRKLTPEQAEFCGMHLRRQITELSTELLDYQSEKALTLLGQVAAERDRLDQFESLASEMGSRHWERIIRLADRAMKKRKRDLACRVFEAALTPGIHVEFLQKKYEQLKAGRWNPDPRK